MTQSHTPGPWDAMSFHPAGISIKAEGQVIARTFQRLSSSQSNVTVCVEESKANAKLIAAAPELLECCEQELMSYEQMNQERMFPLDRQFMEKLRTAIAKAKGE